jgi:hypothetical protein
MMTPQVKVQIANLLSFIIEKKNEVRHYDTLILLEAIEEYVRRLYLELEAPLDERLLRAINEGWGPKIVEQQIDEWS